MDRDGVINKKLENDYVKDWGEFIFNPGVLYSICGLTKIFGRIFIVTNQRGVGLGKMTEEELQVIHSKMRYSIKEASGNIDKIYYCIDTEDISHYRKPNIGLGLLAKQDFPEIEFSKSIMVGDSISDMEFGRKLGMNCVFINSIVEMGHCNGKFNSLMEFYNSLKLGELSLFV